MIRIGGSAMTKLTLSVREDVVEKAKRIARANKTSVSSMFSQFVESVAAPRATRAKIGPLTRRLSGIISFPANKDYKDLLTDALMNKHGGGR
jgi:hypothetical protein